MHVTRAFFKKNQGAGPENYELPDVSEKTTNETDLNDKDAKGMTMKFLLTLLVSVFLSVHPGTGLMYVFFCTWTYSLRT